MNYTFEASDHHNQLEDWIAAHAKAFEGCTEAFQPSLQFPLIEFEGMLLSKPCGWQTVKDYMQYQSLTDVSVARTELELKSNEFFLGNRLDPVACVFEGAQACCDLLLQLLKARYHNREFIVLLSLEPHLGDYEESLKERRSFSVQSLNSKTWWFEARISFCERREAARSYLVDRYLQPKNRNAIEPISRLLAA